jgi:hypothetical protein
MIRKTQSIGDGRPAVVDSERQVDDDVATGVDDQQQDADLPVPLDVPLEVPVGDVIDQMRVEVLDDDHDR